MSVTVSKPQNIRTIEGNGLAVYKDASSNLFVVKDVNGQIEQLSTGGTVTVTGTPNEIVVTPSGTNYQVGIDAVVLNDISTNTSDIATNTGNIATNTTNIATNTTDIGTNTTNIATNTTNIGTNATSIGNNTTQIGLNTTQIGINTGNITTNTTNIGTNTTNIATNTTDIGTNASNIATNTTSIGTNTTNIATNTSSIATVDENTGSMSTTAYCQWNGLTNPYFNFSNGVDTIIPFDSFNVSNILGQVLIGTNIVSPTVTTFTVVRDGWYSLGLNIHFFDQFGDLDIFAGIYNNTSATLLAGIIDQKDVSGNTDSNWYGQIAFNLVAGTTYDFRANFSGGSSQNPFPSDSGELFTSVLIKRLF